MTVDASGGQGESQPQIQWAVLVYSVCSIVSGLSALLLICGFLFPPNVPSPTNDILICLPDPINFGEIGEGLHESRFILKNVSSQPIVLHSIERSCRCSNINVSAKKLLPSEEANCNFSINTAGLRGPVGVSFVVFSSTEGDVGLRKTKVDVVALVNPTVRSSIDQIEFQDGMASAVTIDFTAEASSDIERLNVSSAAVDGGGFDVRVCDSDTVEVTFDPQRNMATRPRYRLSVQFSSPEGYVLSLPIEMKKGG